MLTPGLFARLGWVGVASATPAVLLGGGALFFAACLLYQHAFAAHAAQATAAAAMVGWAGIGGAH